MISGLSLVLVESPTKSRTLQKFLGSKYRVEASMGHIRDLPKSDLGVDIEHNFEPKYIIPRDKKKRVNELKKAAASAKTLYLATDPDREGEAIAWHIQQLLVGSSELVDKKQKNSELRTPNSLLIKRVVFHEITPEAIKEAFAHPGKLDLHLVDAQQARRVLDRLVGYKLSPLLWAKVKRGLSAGRVQSVALRLIVEREKEIEAFLIEEYWSIEVVLQGERGKGKGESFRATVIEKNGQKLEIKNEKDAQGHKVALEKAEFKVEKITQKEVRRFPYPPFTTSTLQQTAANKLGFSAKKTMMVAQNLYEHGLITYMRTDSVNLSAQAIDSVRAYIQNSIGKQYLPSEARIYKSKAKNAQEAHEAIRVTDVNLQASAISDQPEFNRDHVRLYDLIWKRFVACQMNEAILDQTSVDILTSRQSSVVSRQTNSESLKADSYLLRTTGSVVKFDGWLKLYGKDIDEEAGEVSKADEGKQSLPELVQDEKLDPAQVLPNQHFTEPPPRYSDASLIKKLEELGIGRPSTYAPTLSTIQDRFYVERVEKKFKPTSLGVTVTVFLLEYFPNIVDYSFTAQMEDRLDEIATGERQWQPTIKEFYEPFDKQLEETAKVAQKVKMDVETTDRICPDCGKLLIVRFGKFGKFLACSGFPECKHTEGLEEKINAKCPQDGGEIVVRKTRHGKTFYGCKNWPNCKYASWTKPKSDKVDPVIASPEGSEAISLKK